MAGRPSQVQDLFDNPASRIRYEAYSRLQAAAVAFGENLPIPEIVAIGGQSDGKSSLLEAFLGVSAACRDEHVWRGPAAEGGWAPSANCVRASAVVCKS